MYSKMTIIQGDDHLREVYRNLKTSQTIETDFC